jgi:hypothetical protein
MQLLHAVAVHEYMQDTLDSTVNDASASNVRALQPRNAAS